MYSTPVASRLDVDRISEGAAVAPDAPRTAFELLQRGAARWPGRAALRFIADPARIERCRDITYAELFARVRAAAGLFAELVAGPGDVVAVALPNLPEAHFATWGAQAVATAMPLNGALAGDDFVALLESAGARILVADADCWARHAELVTAKCSRLTHVFLVGQTATPGHLDVTVQDFGVALNRFGDRTPEVAAPEPGHLGVISCTAGTTGRPRLVRRSLAADVRALSALRPMFGDLVNEQSVVAGGLPLFHNMVGVASGLLPWSAGACVVAAGPTGFQNPDYVRNYWRIVEHYGVTIAMLVPAVITQLLRVPIGRSDISSLRLAISGSARVSAPLHRRFERAAGTRLLSAYGHVEVGCLATMTPPAGERRAGSAGIALPWHRTRIADVDDTGRFRGDCDLDAVGRLLVNGPGLCEGYVDDDRGEVAWVDCGDGLRWLDTGDLARIDADGYHWIAGRRRDAIRRDGKYIDPSLIEGALLEHPMVAMAAAVARPDPAAGEVPVVYAVLREGGQSDGAALLAFLREEIDAPGATPVEVRIVDALPMTSLGKVDKVRLQQREAGIAVRSITDAAGAASDADDSND